MEPNWKIYWPRLAVEGIAIVASILLAFSIDAWWDDRQQHRAEQVVLQTLFDDLRIKQSLLTEMTRFGSAIAESATTLLLIAEGAEK